MAQTIEAVVDGGQASAGPPLGPALGPAGVNIGQVIAAINEKTAAYKGMKVPVKIEIDDKRNFEVSVGTPPASQLVKTKAGAAKGSGSPKTDFVGNLSMDQVKEIVDMKKDDLLGGSYKAKVREVVGTCVSMGVNVEGINPREAQKKIADGEWEHHFA